MLGRIAGGAVGLLGCLWAWSRGATMRTVHTRDITVLPKLRNWHFAFFVDPDGGEMMQVVCARRRGMSRDLVAAYVRAASGTRPEETLTPWHDDGVEWTILGRLCVVSPECARAEDAIDAWFGILSACLAVLVNAVEQGITVDEMYGRREALPAPSHG